MWTQLLCPNLKKLIQHLGTFLIAAGLLSACVRPWGSTSIFDIRAVSTPQPTLFVPPGTPQLVETPVEIPISTPAMQAEEDIPPFEPTPQPKTYIVQQGDTLGNIARQFNVDLALLIAANKLSNPDRIDVGQELIIPMIEDFPQGPDFIILPDSELVFGPSTTTFKMGAFVENQPGFLKNYHEDRNGEAYSGTELIEKIARDFSVNPRLLLAVLEYQSGWLTNPSPPAETRKYPLGYSNPQITGLYHQIGWAANMLNYGYYLWKAGGVKGWVLADQTYVLVPESINAGTAGVQYLFSLLYGKDEWVKAVSSQGLYATYTRLFGSPQELAFEPLIPAGLTQPEMVLPFAPGSIWYFTGGPHPAFGTGSAWGALDFAPPGEAYGCYTSPEWVTAMADGLIVRSGDGAVVQDLDGDGYEQTGWTILYFHIASSGRVQEGRFLKAGDDIGHPSCEGGVSNGTHLHIARRYNGEWISADGTIPFVLSGWVSAGDSIPYEGRLIKGEQVVTAWDKRLDENQIGW